MEAFKQIICIGSSKLLYDCASIVQASNPNCPVHIIDINPDKPLETYKKTIPHNYMGKAELMQFLSGITEKSLVLSISNRYIFPSDVVNQSRLVIVNLHHGLLPCRPGRNLEMWAIWLQDKYAGITWHFIKEQVDAGDILIQKKCHITDTDTAFSLLRKENALALTGLRELLPFENIENLPTISQINMDRGPLMYMKQLPNDGWLELDWEFEKIKRFLRATDYGMTKYIAPQKVRWKGISYEFRRYVFKKADGMPQERQLLFDAAENSITIWEGCEKVIIQNLHPVN